jgi:hypothetical protein
MRSSIVRAVAALMLGASLVGCSADQSAVCGSVDNLKTSVDNVKKIDVTSSTGITDAKIHHGGLRVAGIQDALSRVTR